MIVDVELKNPDIISEYWESEKDQQDVEKRFKPLGDLGNMKYNYYSYFVTLFPQLLKGTNPDYDGQLNTIDYGYANNVKHIEKYVDEHYGGSNDKYIVTLGLMDRNYEKFYKAGWYVNKNGVMEDDYPDSDSYNEDEESKYEWQDDDNFVTFAVHSLWSERQ